MKPHCLFLALAALLGVGPFSPHSEAASAVINTGLDSSGAPLAAGAIDPQWQIVASADPNAPGPNAYVVSNSIAAWMPQSLLSKWIAPSPNQSVGNADGTYRYRTTFDLTGYNLASVKLRLTIASDNKVPAVRLNGAVTGLSFSKGYQQFGTKYLTSGFVSGVNTLDIDVMNDFPGPTGLRCELHITDTDEPFALHLAVQPTDVVLDWSPDSSCCGAESTTDLSSGLWTAIATQPSIVNGRLALSLARGGEPTHFFRLKERAPALPGPVVWVNEQYGPGIMEYVPFNDPTCDHPACAICDMGTGCQLRFPLDGSIDNEIDASETVYDYLCSTSDGPLQYQWQFRYPPAINSGGYYSAPSVTGKNTSHVTFPPNSFPALAGVDVQWRVILTITKNTPNGVITQFTLFRFQYDSSELQCCPF